MKWYEDPGFQTLILACWALALLAVVVVTLVKSSQNFDLKMASMGYCQTQSMGQSGLRWVKCSIE